MILARKCISRRAAILPSGPCASYPGSLRAAVYPPRRVSPSNPFVRFCGRKVTFAAFCGGCFL